jgi:hypothetical protein
VSTTARLILLWVSQAARVLADGCLRLVAMLEYAGAGTAEKLAAWHLVMVVFVVPFVALSPFNGCLSNALPRRGVLAGSAAFCLLAVVCFGVVGKGWLLCVGFVAVGAALNSAARYAILPGAARDAGLALPRLSAWIELGAAAAAVLSLALGVQLPQQGWPGNGAPLAPGAVAVLVGLNLLCFLGALPAAFPSDVRRPEGPLAAVRGFFRDARRVAADRSSGASLLALAGFQGLVTAGAGALLADALAPGSGPPGLETGAADGLGGLMRGILLAGLGAVLGSAAASLVGNPRRCLGLVPPGAVGLAASLGWAIAAFPPPTPGAAAAPAVPLVPCLLLGFMGGLLNAPLRAAYLGSVPADARGNGTAVMNTTVYAVTAVLAGGLAALTTGGLLQSPAAQLLLLTAVAAAGALASCVWLAGPLHELACVCLSWPFYDVHACGPDLDLAPAEGPLLVVSNSTHPLAPVWLGKVLPRRLRPVAPADPFPGALDEAGPEVGAAVTALRRGEGVLVSREAACRTDRPPRPSKPLAWHVLRAAPGTPVVVCWVEGGAPPPPPGWAWLAFRRRVDVVVGPPEVLPAEVLADPGRTRERLRKACLACRRRLRRPDPAGPADGPEEGETGVRPVAL